MAKDSSPSNDKTPEPGKSRDAVKLPKWAVVQDEILSKMREGAKPDSNLTLHHAPQVLHTMECSGNITCMTHFLCTTGDMFTCQASSSSREHHTLAWKLTPENALKPYRFTCPIRITKLIFIPKCRVYVGYSPTKVLRVFMDPETGCQEVFTIMCVSNLTCMAYNKETEEIIAGGKGFVETWKVSGKEYHTTLTKGKKFELSINKDAEVREVKVDTKHSQLFVVSEKGMCIINYRMSKQTHILVNRHSGNLCCCCVFNSGEYLVTGSTDGAIKVWNSVVFTQVHEFAGHSQPVTALQDHRKEPLLFSASTDGTFVVWRMDSFQKYMSLDLGSKILTVKVLSDSTLFCQTESDIRIYSLNQFHKLFTPLDSQIVRLQRLRCFGEHPNRILVSTEDGFVQMLSPVTGNTITSMSPLPNNQIVNSFVYNSKERSLYTILPNGEVAVLNAARNPMRASELLQPAHDSKKVQALAIMRVRAGSGEDEEEDTLIFMGLKNGQISILESYNMIMQSPVDAHQGAVTCLTSSGEVDKAMMGLLPTSRFLVSGGMDNFVNIWGLEFEPDDEESWNVKLIAVQRIDCVGTPSHIAMFENVICVALGGYGLIKMYRLGGLRGDLQSQAAMAIAVSLTHNSVYDHTDEIVSLDMCPMVGLFVTCSKDGLVKVWDSDNQPVKEMNFSRAIHGVCFANNRGDILVGLHNRIIVIPLTNYLPQDYLERLAQKMFKDEEQEKKIMYKPHKNRRKHWFDPKSLPKFSTDLQKRISEKVEIHTQLMGMLDTEHPAMEREMSLLTETSALSDLEPDAEPLPASQDEGSNLSAAAVKEQEKKEGGKPFNTMERFQSDRRPSNARENWKRARKNLRKASIGEVREEEEDGEEGDKVGSLQRRPSMLEMRKRSRLASLGPITPRMLKDLELAAKKQRLSLTGTMYSKPVDPEEERKKKEEEEKALAEKKRQEELEAERIKTLPKWEQFLLTRKPIIALDGYIPNSVVRATIGYVKPKSPEPEWRLKPVPKANPKHLPEGWTFKDDELETTTKPPVREDSILGDSSDIESVMSVKRESTLMNIKQQQSIKQASMYIGTVYCLLPDGTEPENVPNFSWQAAKEDVADLTSTVRVKIVSPVMKKTAVITAVPQKQAQKDEKKAPPQSVPGYKTTKMVAPKVSIDLTANMDMRIASRPRALAEVVAPKREKSMSFRLPTAGTASATLIEEPDEEETLQEPGQEHLDVPRKSSMSGVSQDRHREASFDRGQTRTGKRPPQTTSGKAPPLRRELTGEELGLLQRIVREDWFPKHVPCAFEPVMDALLAFVDKGDAAVYTKVCDYIVAIAREIGIPRQYLNKCGDKLTKQTSHYAAMIRKKSLWTLKQLGISRKELISAILPSLADAKADIREEAIAALNDLMGDQSEEGLANLMTSLGMSGKPVTTREERQAALKMISERLVSDKKIKLPGGESVQDKVQMWVSSLVVADPTSTYEMKNAQAMKLNSRWDAPPGSKTGSRGSVGSIANDLPYGDDIIGDREHYSRDKSSTSDRLQKSSHARKSVSRKSGKQETSTSSSPVNQAGHPEQPGKPGQPGQKHSEKDHLKPRSVEQGTGMSPFKRGPRTEDEQYLFKRYEHYGSDYGEEEDIYEDRSQFIPIDHDFTPNMFRSETGESEMSEDNLPSLVKLDSSRPRGASIQKYYERQEQATHSFPSADQTDLPSSRRPGHSHKRQQQLRPGDDHSDADLLSLGYETDYEGHTHRTDGATDISSMADSGIVQDVSDTSSNVRSLYKQGQPGLSPIRSTTQLGEKGAKTGKEPEWRDFLETAAAKERKKTERAKREAKEAKEQGKELKKGKRGSGDSLPPITYMSDSQPMQQGEAGMRCLHTIRVVDKDKADAEKTKVEPVPGRLTTHTQEQVAGETSYGMLQMQWSTNVPALPIMPETRGQPLIPKDIMQASWDPGTLPRLMQPGAWTQQNAESLMNELQKKLPNLKSDRGQDFQWKRPLPPARLSDLAPLVEHEEHECEHLRLARKKMHHFTSGVSKSLHLPRVEEAGLKRESTQHLLSLIRQSSMSLLPPNPLNDVIKHITVGTELNVA